MEAVRVLHQAVPGDMNVSVKLLDNEAFYGYRVRRTVNGKLYQEYFSLKKEGKRLGPRLRKQVELGALVLLPVEVGRERPRRGLAQQRVGDDGADAQLPHPLHQLAATQLLAQKCVDEILFSCVHGKSPLLPR